MASLLLGRPEKFGSPRNSTESRTMAPQSFSSADRRELEFRIISRFFIMFVFSCSTVNI